MIINIVQTEDVHSTQIKEWEREKKNKNVKIIHTQKKKIHTKMFFKGVVK